MPAPTIVMRMDTLPLFPADLDQRSYMHAMSDVVVWFDGGCPLCRREIALMRWLDRRHAIEFVNVIDAQACPLPRGEMLAQLHAREDGRLLNGAAAFAAMWRAIPLLRPLGIMARSQWVLRLLERLYNVFLLARPKLQQLARRLDSTGKGA